MEPKMIRVVLAVLFAALLASPLIYKRVIRMRQAAEENQGRERALAHYGFVMTESSQSAGINFVHKAPVLDRKLSHIMEQVASMGAAVSVVDFDHDGWDDLYVVNSGEGSRNALFKNLGNGTFRDVAEQMGVADVNQSATGVSMGAVWGDYDNDGYEDLLLYKWGKPELFHMILGLATKDVATISRFPLIGGFVVISYRCPNCRHEFNRVRRIRARGRLPGMLSRSQSREIRQTIPVKAGETVAVLREPCLNCSGRSARRS